MITLETIVESLKIQLKPHLTDDVIIHDAWLIEMINESRAALMRTLFSSGDNFIAFYQEMTITSIDYVTGIKKIVLPNGVKLMEGIGRKNILYVGPSTLLSPQYHYCSYEELVNYTYHRFGSTLPSYCDMSDHILVLTDTNATFTVKAVIEAPNDMESYVYETTPYPIGANNVRQLEIITFQHIAQKLGMPVDLINNGIDETKNANIGKQAQQQQQEQQQ